MSEQRRAIKSVDIKVWPPNEYTTWGWPRREVGPGWSALGWGCLRVVVNR